MTGWRIGWAITNPELVALCGKVQEALVSCPSAPSQAAAEAALRGPQEMVEEMRAAYQRRRDLVAVLEPVGLLPTIPEGAFYALVDLRGAGLSSRDLSRQLLAEEHVAAAPGSTFGDVAEGMVRISLATADDDLAEGCRRIVRFAERHGALPGTHSCRHRLVTVMSGAYSPAHRYLVLTGSISERRTVYRDDLLLAHGGGRQRQCRSGLLRPACPFALPSGRRAEFLYYLVDVDSGESLTIAGTCAIICGDNRRHPGHART